MLHLAHFLTQQVNTIRNIFGAVLFDRLAAMQKEWVSRKRINGFERDRRGTDDLNILGEIIGVKGRDKRYTWAS